MRIQSKNQEQENRIITLAQDQEQKQAPALLSQDQEHNRDYQEQEHGEDQEQAQVYQDKIYFLVDDFIEREYSGKTEQELKQDRGFFPRLVKYININYLQELLHTRITRTYREPRYNIQQLNYIFNIYIDLVYKYKFNNRPSILEYCILTGISRNTITLWCNGESANKDASREHTVIAKSWLEACESALQDGSGEYVKEIFLLKSCYGYKDQDNTITVKHEVLPTIAAGDIPQVLGIADKLT